MRRTLMRKVSRVVVWSGLAVVMGCLGCAPWLLTRTVASASSESTSEATWLSASLPERFHDASGRTRALPTIEELASIQLDAASDPGWPSFLDPATLGSPSELALENAAASDPAAALAGRLPGPLLDSPGRWW